MQEVHCSFYKKVNELNDGTYSIARYHAISEVPKQALWKEDIFTVLGRDLPRQKNRERISTKKENRCSFTQIDLRFYCRKQKKRFEKF